MRSTAHLSVLRARRRVARDVLDAARSMSAEGLVLGTVGNVSARVRHGFVITPTRLAYDGMRTRDLVVLTFEGEVVAGRRDPSREWRLHASIYRARPDVGAVVHTHSHHATAWSFRRDGPLPALEEAQYYGIGPVGVSPHRAIGGADLADGAVRTLGPGQAALLGSHGVVVVGETPDEALIRARIVERQASIGWLLNGGRAGQPAERDQAGEPAAG